MRRLISRYPAVPILLLVLTTACADDLATTLTDPTPTTSTTEVFTGTINRNGAATHTFTTTRSGSVTATLSSLRPDNTIAIGLSLGTWNGEACQTVIARDRAVVGNVVIGTASSAGTLCVRVYDVGALVAPTKYEVQVVRP